MLHITRNEKTSYTIADCQGCELDDVIKILNEENVNKSKNITSRNKGPSNLKYVMQSVDESEYAKSHRASIVDVKKYKKPKVISPKQFRLFARDNDLDSKSSTKLLYVQMDSNL